MGFLKKTPKKNDSDRVEEPFAVENSDYTSGDSAIDTDSNEVKRIRRRFPWKLVIGLAVAALICLAAFGIFKLIASFDYMRPVKDICSIYNNRETSVSTIYKEIYTSKDERAYNQSYKILANSDIYYDYYEALPSVIEDYYRDIAAVNGSDITMKFDITGSKDKMDEGQLAVVYNQFEAVSSIYSAMMDGVDNMGKDDWIAMADAMGISTNRAKQLGSIIKERCKLYTDFSITAGYYITGRFVLTDKAGNTVDKTEKITISIIKLNGSWYLYEGRAEGIALATGENSLAYEDMLWTVYEDYIEK